MTISDRVFDLAKQKKITQNDIAEACNVRQSTVSDWKRGRSLPSVDKIGDLAKLLDTTTDYLILGIEPPVRVQQGIFGDSNNGNTVTIGAGGAVHLSEFEGELLRIYGALDTEHKAALLMYAYDMLRKCNAEG